jgi:hypothetical protein
MRKNEVSTAPVLSVTFFIRVSLFGFVGHCGMSLIKHVSFLSLKATSSLGHGRALCSLAMASDQSAASQERISVDPLVMFVFVRSDLDWPAGAVMAQACHGEVDTKTISAAAFSL